MIESCSGEVFNVGGGFQFTVSIWLELRGLLRELRLEPRLPLRLPQRPGDQRVYISDIRKAEATFGWRPKISLREGLRHLVHWMQETSGQPEMPLSAWVGS
jgi:CDP-paratose 2-epimerase